VAAFLASLVAMLDLPSQWTRAGALGIASTLLQPTKKKGRLAAALFLCWWRRRELNPRPKALGARHYMLITLFDLVLRQHNVRGAPPDQPL